ncbi:LysR family transcriptional regulator [Jiella avicenniae]|uniref:LysR family transcriptional regulator n=1 Tax=Jiella avicenniae TaxID=2907202 RepID=A0A9X1P0M5_9HYPH|nr:LysR family transcriptional regulator [Jiella avicenniae]MCE7029235.1 LysR family transcriptional regulator [Jiella avicenniae]
MELRELKALICIAEVGSISAAARKLHMTQPALSAGLRRLEDELKVQLVKRHSRGAELTDEGRLVVERAYEITHKMAEIASVASDLAQSPVGKVRLGLPTTVAGGLVPDLLKRVRDRYPQVKLYVLEAMSGALAEHLHLGHLDLAILYDVEPMAGLRSEAILREKLKFLAHPDHPLAGRTEVSLMDIANHPVVMPGDRHSIRQHVDAACLAEGLRLNVVADVDSLSGIVSLVSSGGATIMSTYRVAEQIADGSIVAIEITKPQMEWTAHLAARYDVNRPRASLVVAQLVVETCRELVETGKWPGTVETR